MQQSFLLTPSVKEDEDDQDPHDHEHDDDDNILGVRLDNIPPQLRLQADRGPHHLGHRAGPCPGPQPDHVAGEGGQAGQHS